MVALRARHAPRAGQLHRDGRAAVRAAELAHAAVFGGRFGFQAGQGQLGQLHGAPALGLGRVGGVIDGQHFAVGAAQLHHLRRPLQRGAVGQLALGRHHLHAQVGSHAVRLAAQHGVGAHRELPRGGQGLRHIYRAREDVGAVVFAQRAGAAARQQSRPFGPAAGVAQVLNAADQGERLSAAIQRDAACSADLQRAVVVEQLGHAAHALQRFAAAHHHAVAVGAHGVGGLRALKDHRRAAAWAGRAVDALGGGVSHARCVFRDCGLQAFRAASALPTSAGSYQNHSFRPAFSAARPSWRRTLPASGCPWSSARPAFPAWPSRPRA